MDQHFDLMSLVFCFFRKSWRSTELVTPPPPPPPLVLRKILHPRVKTWKSEKTTIPDLLEENVFFLNPKQDMPLSLQLLVRKFLENLWREVGVPLCLLLPCNIVQWTTLDDTSPLIILDCPQTTEEFCCDNIIKLSQQKEQLLTRVKLISYHQKKH